MAEFGDAERTKSIPVPARETVCGLPETLSAMEREPVRGPPAVGLNVTETVQADAAAKLEPQSLV